MFQTPRCSSPTRPGTAGIWFHQMSAATASFSQLLKAERLDPRKLSSETVRGSVSPRAV